MREKISSSLTGFYKFVFTTTWILAFGAVTVVSLPAATDGAPEVPLAFLLLLVIGGGSLYWSCGRLKRVEIDDSSLYVSNYLKKTTIPLQNVAEVSEFVWLNIHPVTIRFSTDTEFGRQIVFMPRTRPFSFLTGHPVVEDIRLAAALQAEGSKANEGGPGAQGW